MPDYMSRAMEEQANNARRKKQADLWNKNPINGRKVIAEKYNNNRCNGSMR